MGKMNWDKVTLSRKGGKQSSVNNSPGVLGDWGTKTIHWSFPSYPGEQRTYAETLNDREAGDDKSREAYITACETVVPPTAEECELLSIPYETK